MCERWVKILSNCIFKKQKKTGQWPRKTFKIRRHYFSVKNLTLDKIMLWFFTYLSLFIETKFNFFQYKFSLYLSSNFLTFPFLTWQYSSIFNLISICFSLSKTISFPFTWKYAQFNYTLHIQEALIQIAKEVKNYEQNSGNLQCQ